MQDLARELRTLCILKTEIVPLVIGALATMSKDMEQWLESFKVAYSPQWLNF